MVLFELLQLARVFLDYLRIEYLWHVLIMPLTNRNGIRERPRYPLPFKADASYCSVRVGGEIAENAM